MAQRRNRLRVRGDHRHHRRRRAPDAFVLDRLAALAGLAPSQRNLTRKSDSVCVRHDIVHETTIRAALCLFGVCMLTVIDIGEAFAETYRPWCVVYSGRGG